MGSGRFPTEGWTKSAYLRNLRVQRGRNGEMADFDGSAGLVRTDPNQYDIDPHFNSNTSWGSYAYIGGPGAG